MSEIDIPALAKILGVKVPTEKPVPHVAVADVVRHGDKLILPERMSIDDAITMLQRQKKYDEETIILTREVACFPWDGALAMTNAMKDMFGWVNAEPTKGFFGATPPSIVQVEVGYGRKRGVAWGQFSLPGINGTVQTGYAFNGNPPVIQFKMTAKIRRSDTQAITALFDKTEEYVRTSSIYRGQAIKLRFRNADGEFNEVPIPQFLDLSQVKPDELIFSNGTSAAVDTNLFTLLEHTQACRDAQVPLKRGILFEGPYGVGKSLAAHVTAYKATNNGWTYLYCEHADELEQMVRFAHQYQPAVVFCEDIDRVVAGERDIKMDDILNIVDGIESKGTEIIIVLTTNHIGRINKAMLRPGRLDAIISVRPPDAEAVMRLVTQYSRGQLVIDTPQDRAALNEACAMLAGKVPAAIRECVERAKLSALKLTNGTGTTITAAAIKDSAISMQAQFDVMAPDERAKLIVNTRQDVVHELVKGIVERFLPASSELLERLEMEVAQIGGTNP